MFFYITLKLFRLAISANLGHELLLNFQTEHNNLSGKLIELFQNNHNVYKIDYCYFCQRQGRDQQHFKGIIKVTFS